MRYGRPSTGQKVLIMKQTIIAGLLAATFAAGPLAAPALADGKASTRNIIGGAAAAVAAGVIITNINHKHRIRREEDAARARRQAAIRARYCRTHAC